MTTVQVCCHIVIPTIILAVDVSYTPHNEPLGLTFCCIVTPPYHAVVQPDAGERGLSG